jgi:oligoendopeptidase F
MVDKTMNFQRLQQYWSRKFLADNFSFEDPNQVFQHVELLLCESCETQDGFVTWLNSLIEFDTAFREYSSVIQLEYMSNVEDGGVKAIYDQFISETIPHLRFSFNRLFTKLIENPWLCSVDHTYLRTFVKKAKMRTLLFRESNVVLLQRLAELESEYIHKMSTLNIDWQGENLNVSSMRILMGDSDPEIRNKSWIALHEASFNEADFFSELFDEVFALRDQIARNADLTGWNQFPSIQTSITGVQNHQLTNSLQVALLNADSIHRELSFNDFCMPSKRSLRPWDLFMTRRLPAGFDSAAKILRYVEYAFRNMDESLGRDVADLCRLGAFDICDSKSRLDLNACVYLPECSLPIVRMSSIHTFSDLLRLFRLAGSAIISYRTAKNHPAYTPRQKHLVDQSVAAAIGMIAADHITMGAGEQDYHWCTRELMREMSQEASRHTWNNWLYSNPGLDRAARNENWLRFNRGSERLAIDFSGVEELAAHGWHLEHQNFLSRVVSTDHIWGSVLGSGLFMDWKVRDLGVIESIQEYLDGTIKKPFSKLDNIFDTNPESIKHLPHRMRQMLNGSRS